MIGSYRGILLAGLVAATAAGAAHAQENLDAGKSPAQLYANDCAICHKTPQGLIKGAGIFGLAAFLREHYTASREAAAAIAAYVQTVDKGPPAPTKRPGSKRTAKGDEKGKPGEAKSGDTKPEAKSGDTKSGDTKSEPKSGDAKPSEAKAAEPKAVDAKPAEPKADAAKPASKDEKKSDQ